MKNITRFRGFFVLLPALVLLFTACPNDSASGPNTSPKSIVITEIPATTPTLTKCVVKTTQNQPFDEGFSNNPVTGTETNSIQFDLKMAGDSSKGWTGYGGYYIILTDSNNKEYWYTGATAYSNSPRKRYSIDAAVKTINFSLFN